MKKILLLLLFPELVFAVTVSLQSKFEVINLSTGPVTQTEEITIQLQSIPGQSGLRGIHQFPTVKIEGESITGVIVVLLDFVGNERVFTIWPQMTFSFDQGPVNGASALQLVPYRHGVFNRMILDRGVVELSGTLYAPTLDVLSFQSL